jgi:hypothetical protein
VGTKVVTPKRFPVVLLVVCFLVSLICVAYPIYVIRPFRAQGAQELAIAVAVSRFRLPIALFSALIAAGATMIYRRQQSRRLFHGFAVTSCVLVTALAALARVNVYEIMFHPNEHLAFTPASEVQLDREEKVLAIKIGSTARAYPIRGLAYHHIANDTIDKLAIVATY